MVASLNKSENGICMNKTPSRRRPLGVWERSPKGTAPQRKNIPWWGKNILRRVQIY